MAVDGFRRDGLIAAVVVAAAYCAFFTLRGALGHDVAVDHAVVQVALQTVGIGLLVAVMSWLIRKLA